MKLSELVAISNQVEQLLVSENGELTPEIEELLALKEAALPDKIENYAYIHQRLQHSAQFYANKAKDLIKISEACEKVVDNLVERVDKAMTDMGVDSLSGHDHLFKKVKNPPSLVITDPTHIPPSLMTVIPESYKPNNDLIKKALKAGEAIPGAELRQTTRIKIGVNKG